MAATVTLPRGFVIDEPEVQDTGAQLPPGFQLDTEPAAMPAPQPVISKTEQAAIKAYGKPTEQEAPEWAGKYPNTYAGLQTLRNIGGPILEAGSMIAGGVMGTAGAGPMGGVAGAGLGYAGAKNLLESADVALGNVPGKTVKEQVQELPEEIASGQAMEAGGQVIGKGIGAGLSYLGKKLVKPAVTQTLGATTGAGPGAAEEALKGSKPFLEAMRGKTTGDEIVDNVRGALNTLKENRANAYLPKLEQMKDLKGSLDISSVRTKLTKLLKNFGVRGDNPLSLDDTKNVLDFSRSSLRKAEQADIEEIVSDIRGWGTQAGDRNPATLDILKRKLDNFYSDSSQIRSLVTELRGEVKNILVKNVPEYAEMTKGYSEATRLIKDIESGLMLRKQGMTGRVTADNTLRRLTSAMRENFEMRRELLDVLGKEAGEDLSAQVAGYSMSPIVPRGLVGKAFGGGAGVLAYLNPKLYPLLAASSPRAMGEFLSTYGRIGKQIGKFKPAATYAAGAMAGKSLAENPSSLVSEAEAADYTGDLGGTLRDRSRALYEASRDEGPIVGAKVSTASQVAEEDRPIMNAAERAAYNEKTRRLQMEQEARKKGNSATKKDKINVREITVKTKDGEELRYQEIGKNGKPTGRVFLDDPNF